MTIDSNTTTLKGASHFILTGYTTQDLNSQKQGCVLLPQFIIALKKLLYMIMDDLGNTNQKKNASLHLDIIDYFVSTAI